MKQKGMFGSDYPEDALNSMNVFESGPARTLAAAVRLCLVDVLFRRLTRKCGCFVEC
jgi:hypothetical protein